MGQHSGIAVDDEDAWHGQVPAEQEEEPGEDPEDDPKEDSDDPEEDPVDESPEALESTGGQSLIGLGVLAALGVLGGALLLMRRRTASE